MNHGEKVSIPHVNELLLCMKWVNINYEIMLHLSSVGSCFPLSTSSLIIFHFFWVIKLHQTFRTKMLMHVVGVLQSRLSNVTVVNKIFCHQTSYPGVWTKDTFTKILLKISCISHCSTVHISHSLDEIS